MAGGGWAGATGICLQGSCSGGKGANWIVYTVFTVKTTADIGEMHIPNVVAAQSYAIRNSNKRGTNRTNTTVGKRGHICVLSSRFVVVEMVQHGPKHCCIVGPNGVETS